MEKPAVPLNHYSLLATRELDELESFIASKYLELVPCAGKRLNSDFKSRINAFRLPNTCISYLQFPHCVELIAHPSYPCFNLSLPAKGSFSVRINNREILGDKESGTLGSPENEQRIILNQNSSRFCISFTQNAVVSMLESLLGQPLSTPLVFSPGVDLNDNAGKNLMASISMLLNTACEKDNAYCNPITSTQFEQFLISLLLTMQPHNYSQALKSIPAPASRDVKRVLDYIHANLSEPILVSELVAVCGVSGRSLFAHFRRFTGRSPLAYITGQRLARARQDLTDNTCHLSVTQIATNWGFTQLGRFSGLYRKTYGELPSETRRRTSIEISTKSQLH